MSTEIMEETVLHRDAEQRRSNGHLFLYKSFLRCSVSLCDPVTSLASVPVTSVTSVSVTSVTAVPV
jgi:hypothetical protein